MHSNTAIIGSNPVTKNIGWEISNHMDKEGKIVCGYNSQTVHLLRMNDFDNLVISIGRSMVRRIDELGPDDSPDMIRHNLLAPINYATRFLQSALSRHVLGLERPRAKLVLIGSMASEKVLTGMSLYSAAKAGLAMFGKSAAFEASEYADVFVVNPASVQDTPMAGNIIQQTAESNSLTLEQAKAKWDAGNLSEERTVQKSDIASLVSFLLEPSSSRLSGSVINVTGGQR